MLITLFYASLLAAIMAFLSIRVAAYRGLKGIPWGDGSDPQLSTRIRVFGNFTEYVPMIVVMMALLESGDYPEIALHAMGVTLLVARILHALFLSAGELSAVQKLGRGIGAALTWLILIYWAISGLWLVYSNV